MLTGKVVRRRPIAPSIALAFAATILTSPILTEAK
jgi:hypothetical protein